MTVSRIEPTYPLSSPSHAEEHNRLNQSVVDLDSRITELSEQMGMQIPLIEQARLTAHTWVLRGPLPAVESPPRLLLPVLWNITGRVVEYFSAKATAYTAPVGADLIIQIVTGVSTGEGIYDTGTMTTILTAPLVIPAGGHESEFVYTSAGDFVGHMDEETFVAAYVQQTGVGTGVSDPARGGDLTIQLNRLL